MSATGFDPGWLRLRLHWQGGRIGAVGVDLSRPNAVAILRGRPADQAARMLPLLYSICGAAQGVAAALALRAARGESVGAGVSADALTEARREHLWRLLLDWPQVLGLPSQEGLLVAGRRQLQAGGFDAWATATLREPLARIDEALRDLPEPAAADVRLLPALTAAETLALWPRLDAAFAAAPSFHGSAAETGALARYPELAGAPPLRARVKARMTDLAEASGLGLASAATVAPGVGRATVETARGLLMHEVTLDGERIADYVIVAPTEWNFHAAGVLEAWLEGAVAASADEAKFLASRAVLALDPCVRSEIEVSVGA